MPFTVKDKAEYLATLRWMEVSLMETIASWVPTTPEMEIKVLFGRHVWELAQNADALGKRTFELRAPLHYSLPPVEELRGTLGDLRKLEATSDRVSVFYDAVLPSQAARYRDYEERTDELLDEPSIRAIERIRIGHERMLRERQHYCAEVAAATKGSEQSIADWRRRLSVTPYVVQGEGVTLARAVSA